MENQKDTINTGLQNKDTSVTDIRNKPYYSSIFDVSLIVKKTDKIVTALYMVTDFFDDSEPMKLRLRTLSIQLLSSVRVFDVAASSAQDHSFREIKSQTEEIMAIIEIAHTVGVMSEMNASILTKEFHGLVALVEKNYELSARGYVAQKPGSRFALKDDMFYVGSNMASPAGVVLTDQHSSVSHQKDNANENNNTKKSVPFNNNNKGHHYGHSQSEVDNHHGHLNEQNKKADMAMKIARRNDILAFIKDKGEVTIKDISSVIVGYGEKTLQRLLGSLVSEGVLKRTGDKRWSKYSIFVAPPPLEIPPTPPLPRNRVF